MQRILSSMRAETGMELKQSMNDFHSLVEYRFLPGVRGRFTFLEKSIDSGDGGRFMVASEDVNVAWVFDLQTVEQADGLDSLSSPINIIPQE